MLYAQSAKGFFTAQKSNRTFSHIGVDHNHEQINAKLKGVGGAIGLTENDASLAKWLMADPEVSRMVEEFEKSDWPPESDSILEHHDSNKSAQKHFCDDEPRFRCQEGRQSQWEYAKQLVYMSKM